MGGIGFRRVDLALINSFPPIEEDAPRPPRPRIRRALSRISLRILATIYLPLENIVRIVEETVGWPEITFGNQEAGGQILERPEEQHRELVTLVQALRDINLNSWTSATLYFMRNLQMYNALLQSLLKDLEFFQGRRSAGAVAVQPPPGLDDLAGLAQALEALATDLGRDPDRNNFKVIHLDQDQYVRYSPLLHQLIRFLR